MIQTSSLVMAFLIFALAAHDCTFTEDKIKRYGLEVETSWLFCRIYPWVGLQMGLALGIMIPTLGIVSVLAVHNWTIALAMWLGAKILNTRYQYLSLALQAEIDRVRGVPMSASSPTRDDGPSGPESS